MLDPPLLWLLLLLAAGAAIATENKAERQLNVLAGGHLRILNEDPDDTELLTAKASGSKDKKRKHNNDEDRKTLSQQVADGRYGLIQKEIFGTPHKKPGVLSYDSNSEIPKDNINNLGGLNKNEIWLAENHLLVVRGGVYPPHDDKNDNDQYWPAIDDYKAPKRPVKLPAHPKVPPPFPVQLTDDGPLQILGTNASRTLNGSLEQEGYPLPPPEGYVPGTGPFFPPLYPYPPNATAGQAPFPGAPFAKGPPPGEPKLGAPFPPLTSQLNGTLPPYFASLPPGAVILPPPNNLSDAIDEDDPSIYYPPPYSFYYPKDNSSNIRPGPLVPGIILPPPPDFFAPLEENTTSTTTRRPTAKHKYKTTTKPFKQIRPTTNPVPSTSVLGNKATRRPAHIIPSQTPTEINNELNPPISTFKPLEITTLKPIVVHKIVTVLPSKQVPSHSGRGRPTATIHRQRKPQSGVTILKPITTAPTVKPAVTIKVKSKPVSIEATPQPEIYIFNNEVTGKPFAIYGPPQRTKTTSTTQLPVKVYYTTSNEIETNSVTEYPIKFRSQDAISVNKVVKQQPNYFYYDAKSADGVTTPQTFQELQDAIYELPRDYFVSNKRVVPPRQKPRYLYSSQRTQKPRYEFLQQTSSRPDSFKVHIARLQKHLQYFTTQKPSHNSIYSPRPVYQYSFQAAGYQPQQNQRPTYSYQIQQPQNQYYQQAQNQYYQQPQFQHHGDYRAPQPLVEDSQDKFRPMPHYSVQIQPAVDITPTEIPQAVYKNPAPQNYYQGNNERGVPSRYYSNQRPEYDYDEAFQKQQYNQQANQNPATSKTVSQDSFAVTPNPIYQGFYTKPDEGYFDDQTKKYFTIFGKKIPNATTPMPQVEYTTQASVQTQNHARLQQQPQPQQQISLAGDTLVNYLHPRPGINPHAEFIQVNPQKDRSNYPRVVKYSPKPVQNLQQQSQYVAQAPQTQQSIQYNTRLKNEPEIIKAIPIRVPESDSQRGSFISYELPGDNGAHFYFLTPQLANRRDQGAGYYYSQPNANANRARRYERQVSETVHRKNIRQDSEAVER